MRESKLPKLTEKAFTQQIRDLARSLGWRVFHPWLSIHSERGWPDLAFVRERLVLAELKTDTGKLSPKQEEWIAALKTAGVEVYVWRPANFNTIVEILKWRSP